MILWYTINNFAFKSWGVIQAYTFIHTCLISNNFVGKWKPFVLNSERNEKLICFKILFFVIPFVRNRRTSRVVKKHFYINIIWQHKNYPSDTWFKKITSHCKYFNILKYLSLRIVNKSNSDHSTYQLHIKQILNMFCLNK